MIAGCYRLIKVSMVLQILIICCCATFCSAQSSGGILLRDGVVIDKAKGDVYLNTPDKQLKVISAKTGALKWEAKDPVKPLAFSAGQLIGQVKDLVHPYAFTITTLPSKDRGKVSAFQSIDLPADVHVNTEQNAASSFSYLSKMVDNNLYISWQFQPHLSGLFKGDSARNKGHIVQTGAIKVEGTTGKPSLMRQDQLPVNFEKPMVLSGADRIPALNGDQFLSADEKSVLVSVKALPDSVFNNYLWSIYDRKGKKLGEIYDHRSYAAFYVTGNVIIYEVGPFSLRTGNDIQQIPLKIVGADLRTGKMIWEKEIFDNNYRGSVPPERKNQ